MITRLRRFLLAASALASAAILLAIGWFGILELNLLRTGITWAGGLFILGLALALLRDALTPTPKAPKSASVPLGLRVVHHQPDDSAGKDAAEDPSDPDRSAVVLSRVSQWVNKLRDVDVYLDGLQVASLGDGQTVQLDIDPGPHRIQVRIDSSRSTEQTLHLRAGETVRFTCGSLIAGWKILIAPYIYLARHSLYLTTTSGAQVLPKD